VRRRERTLLVCLVLAGLCFYAFNAAHYVDQPLRIEESEWPPMGKTVYEHGIPEISPEENHRIRLLKDYSVQQVDYVGLWHPPLYMYAMAAFIGVAGTDATTSLRLIGVMGLLACCVLLFLLAREVAPRRAFRLGAVSTFLLLIHPYAIQGSLFLDIDTSIYPATFLLFLWLLVRFDHRGDWPISASLVLGAAFALILWTKLTTVVLLVPLCGLFWVFRSGWMTGLIRSAVVFGSGFAVFLSTYGLYVWATGQSFWFTFEFTFGNKSDRFVWLQKSSAQLRNAVDWHISWFVPALLMIIAVYGLIAVRRWMLTQRVTPVDLLWAIGASIVVFYSVIVPNGTVYQGKYGLPALPLLVFAATALLLGLDDAGHRSQTADRRPSAASAQSGGAIVKPSTLALAVVVTVLAALAIPDLLTDQNYINMLAPAKLAVAAGSAAALWIASRGIGARVFHPAAALIVLAGLFGAQSLKSYRADVSPLYPMTDTRDFVELAERVNAAVRPGEVALVSKDLGIRIEERVIEGEDIWLVRGDSFEASALRRLNWITVVAADTFGPPLGGETFAALARCFEFDAVGGAAIYTRKRECGRGTLELP